jgi:hypothetical protein
VANLALLKYNIARFDFTVKHLVFDIFASLVAQLQFGLRQIVKDEMIM